MATEAHSWKDLYPFASRYLDLDGLRYHCVDEGEGKPLLMVHGNPTWSFYWRHLLVAFRPSHRVVAPDHMGCGLSDKPQQYNYTLTVHIKNLIRLIRQLDLRDITLLVHDWGGAIGLGAALEEPDRFERFVLFNTGAFPPPYVPWRIRVCRLPILGTWAIRRLNLFARAALWMAVADRRSLSPAARAGLLAPYDNWENRVAIDRFVRDIPVRKSHPTWDELARMEASLPEFADRPVQLIWGMRDWCFRPTCLERFAQLFPRAEVHRMADAGHYVVEERSETIISLVRDFVA